MPQYKHPATHICVESYNLSLLLHKNEKEGPQESCYVVLGVLLHKKNDNPPNLR